MLLTNPGPAPPIPLITDASKAGVGAALQQHADGSRKQLEFFSKWLQLVESGGGTFGVKLLAVHLVVRNFEHALEGRRSQTAGIGDAFSL